MNTTKIGIPVLVTGATGMVGPTLIRSLLESGYQVRALIRPTSSTIDIPSEVILYVGDINDADAVREAMQGVRIVFHLAAKLHITDSDQASVEDFETVNVRGTRTIVEAAEAADVERLVFFSTINVYGKAQNGEIFGEDSPLLPESSYAVTKAQAEQIVLNAVRKCDGKPIGTILRSAAVYGPRMKGNYARLVRGIYQGWFVPIGKCQNRRTLIFHEDLASVAIRVAHHSGAISEIYNISDGSYYALRKIIDEIYRSLGRKPVKFYIPVLPMKMVAFLLERLFNLLGKEPFITPKTIDNMLEDRAVSGKKIQELLDFKPATNLQQGWKSSVNGLIDDFGQAVDQS